MHRIHRLVIGALAGAACAGAACVAAAQAGARPAALASRVAKVELASTSLGKILVDSSGDTLYRFTRDGHDRDACAKVKGCLAAWPALSTSGKPIAGPGVKASMLSTIKLANGTRQVTYAGHPLYRYAETYERDETGYVGAKAFGGTWEAVNAAGGAVRSASP